MNRVTFKAPRPLSVNNAYSQSRNGRRFLVDEAKTYKEEIGLLAKVAAQRAGWEYRTGQRIKFSLVVHFPDRRRRDISNVVKLAEDATAEALGFDDRVVDVLHVERGEPRKPACAYVTVEVLGQEGAA